MKIDFNSLRETGSHKSLKKEIELPDIEFRNQEIETPFPFQLELDIYTTKESYVLSGNLKGKLVLDCSRCLEKFDYNIDIKLEEELFKNEVETPAEYDLTDIFVENILLAIPIKPICSEDCKGLCSICGQNLNEEECDCEREILDPRMAKLKNFFTDEEEDE